MTAGHTSTEQIADMILRGEEEGWLPLSEVARLGDGLSQEPLEALFERLDAHGIDVRDDCGRPGAPLGCADDTAAAATATVFWLFLGEIPQFPPLTAGEELELAIGVERGDRPSRERMISSNLRLVVSIAKRNQDRGLPILALIRAGVLGLVHAVDTFDWRLGHRFASYATWCVLRAMHRLEQDSLRHEARPDAKTQQRLGELVA